MLSAETFLVIRATQAPKNEPKQYRKDAFKYVEVEFDFASRDLLFSTRVVECVSLGIMSTNLWKRKSILPSRARSRCPHPHPKEV